MTTKGYFWVVVQFFFFLLASSAEAEQKPQKTYQGDSLTVYADRDKLFVSKNSIIMGTSIPNRLLPVTVETVSATMLANQAGDNLTDALKNVSGANLQTGYGVHEYFLIRGFNSLDNGLILTDLTPEPEAAIYDLYNIDRVEVIKGPAAFLYGGNPLAGAVNLVHKKPLFDRFARWAGGYGSFNNWRQSLDIGWGNRTQTVAGRLNGVWQQSDHYRNDKHSRMAAVNPSIAWRPDKSNTLTLEAEYVDSRYQPDTGLPLIYNLTTRQLDQFPQVSRKISYQSPWDVSEQKLNRLKADYTHQWDQARQLQMRFFYTDLDWFSRGTLVIGAYPSLPGTFLVGRTLPILQDRQKWMGWQTHYSNRFNTGTVQHHLSFGIDGQRRQDDFQYDIIPVLPSIDLENPVQSRQTPLYNAYPYLSGHVTGAIIAPYATDLLRLSRRWSALVGGRFDYIRDEDESRKFRHTYKPFSPMVGIMCDASPAHSVYVHWGRAFAPPSTLVSEEREPEESRQWEVGLKSEFPVRNIKLNVAVYDLEKSHMAIADANNILLLTGSQRSRGIECEFIFQPSTRWSALLQYAYCDARLTKFADPKPVGEDIYGRTNYTFLDRSGHSAPFAPKHLVNLWTNWRLSRHIGLSGGTCISSRQYIDEDNVVALDPVCLAEINLYYERTKWRWQVNAKNILDAAYWLRGNGGYSIVPGLPRRLATSFEVRL